MDKGSLQERALPFLFETHLVLPQRLALAAGPGAGEVANDVTRLGGDGAADGAAGMRDWELAVENQQSGVSPRYRPGIMLPGRCSSRVQ